MTGNIRFGEDTVQMELSYFAGGSVLDFNNLKLALMISMSKWMPTFWSSNYTCRYMPKDIHTKVQSSRFQNRQKSETIQISIKKKTREKITHISSCEIRTLIKNIKYLPQWCYLIELPFLYWPRVWSFNTLLTLTLPKC